MILVQLTGGAAVELVSDQEPVSFVEAGLRVGERTYYDLKADNAEIITDVPAPPTFVAGAQAYVDGEWQVIDQAAYEAALEAAKGPVPERVSMLQARLALIQLGELANVQALIDASGDVVLQTYWERSTEGFERGHPAIALVATARDWSPAYVDDMFRLGVTLT